jgi:hypothetical protein
MLVEKVGGGLRSQYEAPDNPLQGVWGSDPDHWVDELRGRWAGRAS